MTPETGRRLLVLRLGLFRCSPLLRCGLCRWFGLRCTGCADSRQLVRHGIPSAQQVAVGRHDRRCALEQRLVSTLADTPVRSADNSVKQRSPSPRYQIMLPVHALAISLMHSSNGHSEGGGCTFDLRRCPQSKPASVPWDRVPGRLASPPYSSSPC